jgi:hypothetical protein
LIGGSYVVLSLLWNLLVRIGVLRGPGQPRRWRSPLRASGPWSVGVVGATGAVGTRLLSILEQRGFPVAELRLYSSPRSKGRSVRAFGRDWTCRVLEAGCFEGLDWIFLDASDEISKAWVPEALGSGAWVIEQLGRAPHGRGRSPGCSGSQ